MEKWSEERIAAYKQFVEGREKDIEQHERNYNDAVKIMRSSIESIERLKMRKTEQLNDLWLQGWKRNDGQWIRLEENEKAASKS
ncbi:hypothetical protein [Bacillus mobilis]|uniref:hypothetical protein n=1 Tax=Bacillus mobilis TaxID=2026190 RepID=UPI003CF90BDD